MPSLEDLEVKMAGACHALEVPFRDKLPDFIEVRVDYTGPADQQMVSDCLKLQQLC